MSRLALPLAASLLVLAGCPHEPAPQTPAPAPTPGEPFVAGMPLEIVETPPAETTLDHPDVQNAAEVWLAMIQGAKRSIDIEHFYISNAPGGKLEPVLAAIEEAVRRGVRVRLLADVKFYLRYPESVDRLASHGVLVRKLDLRSRDGVQHAKYMVVDEGDAYVGSQNMDYRSLEHIQEIGARVRVPEVVAAYARVFAQDWWIAGGEVAAESPDTKPLALPARFTFGAEEVRILPTASPKDLLPAGVPWELPELLARIDGAERTLDVQVLTYRTKMRNGTPWTDLDDALRRAAKRGVRVRLLVADWSKREASLEGLRELSRVPGISIRFLVIPQSSSGFIPFARVAHAKYMVVDGKSTWIGTSNWEGDYFTVSRNVGLFIDGKAIAGQLERIFEDGFGGAYAEVLDPDRKYEPPRIE
ncbi:phospholipase D-like domain-containing protein [Polyangium mundeleinium]|uniref:Phospholipase D-like domain-containing protein n=1 Tax=Polyangium mundeleinium TaxID=2995306 RepID=A0ABT5ED50_9BACT|nr:phospholipase D-like domain-containing protein [Polyangium mundeleinium]MDC0739745.1 phospholipase D-like domain-containing protein [Polyangium mundeleinium]